MSNDLYVDISAWQPTNIDWHAYKAWSAAGDGISRVAIKASEGVGYTDPGYHAHRDGALAAGIDVIISYHFARPDLNGADAEADWLHQVVGPLRSQDQLMLDMERSIPQPEAQWAFAWLTREEINQAGKRPYIYASDNFVRTRLQDERLSVYPLILANWTFNPNARPACPPPWSHYDYLQWTDHLQVPGIPGFVDADLYTGPELIPSPPPPGPPPEPPGRTYTVVSGDTLWSIGERFNVPWESLYNANADVIEAKAREVGLINSDHGRWIFPETVLRIP